MGLVQHLSIYGGFAEWEKGNDDETSFAHRVEADGWENELLWFCCYNNKSKRYPVVQACHLHVIHHVFINIG